MGFEERPYGKDLKGQAGIELDGIYYPNLKLIKALAKALIKKGVLSKQDIKDELL